MRDAGPSGVGPCTGWSIGKLRKGAFDVYARPAGWVNPELPVSVDARPAVVAGARGGDAGARPAMADTDVPTRLEPHLLCLIIRENCRQLQVLAWGGNQCSVTSTLTLDLNFIGAERLPRPHPRLGACVRRDVPPTVARGQTGVFSCIGTFSGC